MLYPLAAGLPVRHPTCRLPSSPDLGFSGVPSRWSEESIRPGKLNWLRFCLRFTIGWIPLTVRAVLCGRRCHLGKWKCCSGRMWFIDFVARKLCFIWSAVALHIYSLLISSLFPKILGCRCLLESWGLLLRLCYIFGSSKSCCKVLLVPTYSRIIAQQFCVSVPLPTKIVEFVFGTPGMEMWDYNGKFYQHNLKVAIWTEETLSSDNILVSLTVLVNWASMSRYIFL